MTQPRDADYDKALETAVPGTLQREEASMFEFQATRPGQRALLC